MRGLIDGLPEWFTRFIIAYFIKYLACLSVLQTSPFFADFFMLENLRVIYLFFVISTDLKNIFTIFVLCAPTLFYSMTNVYKIIIK